jgi:molybdopterin-containing oxidoreductase family membrane subunit
MPYPNTMGLWPNFRSPLIWDVFAISTYGTVSALFWYVGLIPDMATLRDRAKNKAFKIVYGMAAMGWRGSARHWHNYETAYLLLAGLATPLVISVHTVVSLDFAAGLVPGWHATIFPPYFVAGAIYAGFAMVLTLSIPLRKAYGLEDFITMKHLENMAKVMLATGLIVAYGYTMEAFMAWYSGNPYESFMMTNRMTGPYAPFYWALILCNVIAPNFLWVKNLRTSVPFLFFISLVVSVGMWLERFVIIPTSLHRDFLPSSWGHYSGTFYDWTAFLGTIGLFLTLFFLFIRFMPVISIFEMRTIVPEPRAGSRRHEGAASGHARHPRPDGRVPHPARRGGGGAPRARPGLQEGRRLLAVPDGGAVGGARLPPLAAAAHGPLRRHRGACSRSTASSTGAPSSSTR